MLVPTDPSYPELRQVRFARVGETIAKLRVGVVDAQGTEVRWVSIPSPNEGFYLGQVSWAGNSEELLVDSSAGSGRTGLLHRQRDHGRGEANLRRVRSGLGHRQLSPERRPVVMDAWMIKPREFVSRVKAHAMCRVIQFYLRIPLLRLTLLRRCSKYRRNTSFSR